MNDIEILEWVCINKLYIDTHNECDYHNIHTAIENLIQRNKDLEQILELMSKSLDNISYDQIPIAIEELKFKLQDLEQIEKEHKEENGRLRDRIKELEKVILLDSKPIILGMIPISRIKEKIEELTKIKGDLATYIATSERIKVLQELLEESD